MKFIAGRERHTHMKITDNNTCTRLTYLNITLLFTFKQLKASSKSKCTKNEQMVLLLGGKNTHMKTTDDNTSTHLMHSNITLSFTFKDSITNKWRNCS